MQSNFLAGKIHRPEIFHYSINASIAWFIYWKPNYVGDFGCLATYSDSSWKQQKNTSDIQRNNFDTFSSVQFSSVTQSCPTLWPHESQHARLPCPSPFRSLLKPMSIESVMPSSHLTLCHPLLLLPPILCPQSFDTLVFFIQILEISEFSCWHHILAIYCHITNCPETTWLKTAISFL